MERKTILEKAIMIALILSVGLVYSYCPANSVFAASKPSQVNLVSVKAVSKTKIKLTWKKANNAKGYEISRNGKTVQKVGESTYTDKGLSQGTKYTYKVRAFNITKKKQWYNKKTKKWVSKKPKKKYRGKSRTKTIYTYGKYSVAKSTTTTKDVDPTEPTSSTNPTKPTSQTNPTQPSTGGNTSGAQFNENTNIRLNYGNANIHIGQKWTETIRTQLATGCSGTESVSRPNYVMLIKNNNFYTFNETVYMFDTKDYDNYLMVYVANNQIIRWVTSRANMGANGQTVLMRGAKDKPQNAYFLFKNTYQYVEDVQRDGVLIGGFQSETTYVDDENWVQNPTVEKRIGYHLINAYRVLNGVSPLEYNIYLDGENMTWSGTIEQNGWIEDEYGNTIWIPKTFTNVRFGAQPWAETMEASGGVISHSTKDMTAGPLADIPERMNVIDYASQITVRFVGENVGTGSVGESCLGVYQNSSGHLAQILDSKHKYIGIGICGNCHCEIYGRPY